MLMKELKLKYRMSKTTSIDSSNIKELIILNLDHENYKVKSIASNRIIFDGEPGRSNFGKLGEGQIEITRSDEGSVIELEYYADLLAPLIFFMVPLFIGVSWGMYFFPIAVALALSIQEFIRKKIWAVVAERLLEDLLK